MTRISLAERGSQIKRKLDAGLALPPAGALVNSGRHRTPEKRRLLESLRAEAEAQGRAAPFSARY